jgi:tetratricopeptide (TPR) repeat protein
MKRSILAVICLALTAYSLVAQDKPDALKLYRNGRDLESAGRVEDAKTAYTQAIEVCKQELTENPKNIESYTIYGWALVRTARYQEAVTVCTEALKVNQDVRIIETLGEANFYLSNYRDSLKYMQAYIDAAPRGERISTAYFFSGEIYRLSKQPNHADIAYSAAVYLEPSISLWWYRLGGARETLGDKKGALDAYQRAIKLRPDYKEANEGLSRVRT